MTLTNTNKRIGIMKGGQLAWMMLPACKELGLTSVVMDENPKASCSDLADEFVVADASNASDVYNFGKTVDVLTFEFENVNIKGLDRLKQEGYKVSPDPSIIRLVQDKGLQKQFYLDNNIPTSPFHLVQDKTDLSNYSDFFPAVQKLRSSGYDGRGVVVLDGPNDTKAFDAPSVLEKKVDIYKEIAIIVVRSNDGDVKLFPTVEMVFHPQANMLDFLFAPADIEESINEKAKAIATDLANKLGLVGMLAVELFIDQDLNVLVNEIAPRPHNSGHHTIEANITSQFENHLRAVAGLPLGDSSMQSPAVMLNLVGEDGFEGDVVFNGIEEFENEDGVFFHDYQKKQTRPFRKMGHVTILNDDLDVAKNKAYQIKEKVKVVSCNQ